MEQGKIRDEFRDRGMNDPNYNITKSWVRPRCDLQTVYIKCVNAGIRPE